MDSGGIPGHGAGTAINTKTNCAPEGDYEQDQSCWIRPPSAAATLFEIAHQRLNGRPIRQQHLRALIRDDRRHHRAVNRVAVHARDARARQRNSDPRPQPDRQVRVHRGQRRGNDLRQSQPHSRVEHLQRERADEELRLVHAEEIITIRAAAHKGHRLVAIQPVAAGRIARHRLRDRDRDPAHAVDQAGKIVQVKAQIIAQRDRKILFDRAHRVPGPAARQRGLSKEMRRVDAVLPKFRDRHPQVARDR